MQADLDQTTMIGSALDLDSLDGEAASASTPASAATDAATAGSQVGLVAGAAV